MTDQQPPWGPRDELGSVESGSTNAYSDAGTHYLQVIADGCSWTLRVMS